MGELTGKQRRRLRGIGQTLKATCILGKAGLTAGLVDNISRELARHELVKVRMPADPPKQRRQTAEAIAKSTKSECVAMLGRTALLYRPNADLPTGERIDLPS